MTQETFDASPRFVDESFWSDNQDPGGVLMDHSAADRQPGAWIAWKSSKRAHPLTVPLSERKIPFCPSWSTYTAQD